MASGTFRTQGEREGSCIHSRDHDKAIVSLAELVFNKSFCKEIFIVRFLFERQTQPDPTSTIIPDSSALTDNEHRIPKNAPAVSQCPLCSGGRSAGAQGQHGRTGKPFSLREYTFFSHGIFTKRVCKIQWKC